MIQLTIYLIYKSQINFTTRHSEGSMFNSIHKKSFFRCLQKLIYIITFISLFTGNSYANQVLRYSTLKGELTPLKTLFSTIYDLQQTEISFVPVINLLNANQTQLMKISRRVQISDRSHENDDLIASAFSSIIFTTTQQAFAKKYIPRLKLQQVRTTTFIDLNKLSKKGYMLKSEIRSLEISKFNQLGLYIPKINDKKLNDFEYLIRFFSKKKNEITDILHKQSWSHLVFLNQFFVTDALKKALEHTGLQAILPVQNYIYKNKEGKILIIGSKYVGSRTNVEDLETYIKTENIQMLNVLPKDHVIYVYNPANGKPKKKYPNLYNIHEIPFGFTVPMERTSQKVLINYKTLSCTLPDPNTKDQFNYQQGETPMKRIEYRIDASKLWRKLVKQKNQVIKISCVSGTFDQQDELLFDSNSGAEATYLIKLLPAK